MVIYGALQDVFLATLAELSSFSNVVEVLLELS